MTSLVDHAYILMTIAFTVYSQLVMRWQVGNAGPLPSDISSKVQYVVTLLINPWVISGVFATFCAGVCWMLAMTKFEISYAYPFVSLTYVLMLVASVILFHEAFTLYKFAGTLIVLLGLFIIGRG